MKIKAFFACIGLRPGERDLLDIRGAGATAVNLRRNEFSGGRIVRVSVPLYIVIAREPTDASGEYTCRLRAIGPDQALPSTPVGVRFSDGEDLIRVNGAMPLEFTEPSSWRFELSIDGTSEVADWPFRVQVEPAPPMLGNASPIP